MPLNRTMDETGLLSAIANGDEKAFAQLFHKWRDRLFFFILKLTGSPEIAEDVLQDVFTQIWQNRSSAATIENFQAYLYKAARNRISSSMRRISLETLILTELQKNSTASEDSPEQIVFRKELHEKIQLALRKLPPQQRQVYRMTREDGLKQHTIASLLNISVSTVKNHMTQALRTLKQEIRHFYHSVWLMIISGIFCLV